MSSNKYIITKIKCWPVFKQDPYFWLECIDSVDFGYNWCFVFLNKVPQRKISVVCFSLFKFLQK